MQTIVRRVLPPPPPLLLLGRRCRSDFDLFCFPCCSAGARSRALQRRFGFTAHLRRLRASPIGDGIQLHRRRPPGARPLRRRRSFGSAVVVAERRRRSTADRGQGQRRAMRCPRRLSSSADRPFHRDTRYIQPVHGEVRRSAIYIGTLMNEYTCTCGTVFPCASSC